MNDASLLMVTVGGRASRHMIQIAYSKAILGRFCDPKPPFGVTSAELKQQQLTIVFHPAFS